MYVDSHCHLDCIKLDEFDDDYHTLIQRCLEAGVEHMLCVSIDMHKYPQMLAQAEDYPQVSVSAGVHPMADQAEDVDAETLTAIASNEKVVAIGETGLDYYYVKGDRKWQQERFRTHIQCALELDKPVIVHTRDAGRDTLERRKRRKMRWCYPLFHRNNGFCRPSPDTRFHDLFFRDNYISECRCAQGGRQAGSGRQSSY